MLVARLHDEDKKVVVMIVLEPGNVEKLKAGQPIHKFLNEFMPELPTSVELLFSYTPDIEWVIKKLGEERDAVSLAEVIDESLSRPPVFRRDKSAEELKRAF